MSSPSPVNGAQDLHENFLRGIPGSSNENELNWTEVATPGTLTLASSQARTSLSVARKNTQGPVCLLTCVMSRAERW